MFESGISSLEILLNLSKCEVAFYAVYYIVCSVCFGLYRLDHFDGKIPFDFETWIYLPDCCSNWTSEETVNLLSMEVSFAVSGVSLAAVVRERVWDYALTVTTLHTALSCLVMLSFPLKWSWWVCYAVALALMLATGELMALVLRKKFRSKVHSVRKDSQQVRGYLFAKS